MTVPQVQTIGPAKVLVALIPHLLTTMVAVKRLTRRVLEQYDSAGE